MDQGISTRTEDYLRSNRKKVRWKRVVSLMSGIVMFCTTYIFILPAITMTPELICGQTEHIHDAGCYETVQPSPEVVPTLTCMLEEREDSEHTHDAACYENEETLVCPLVEDEEHTHEDSCYETAETLTCPLEEGFVEGHTHAEDCWSPVSAELSLEEQEMEAAPICGMEEHTHSTSCYSFPLEESGPAYYCGFYSEHTHDEGCWFESGELQCTLPEHTHSEDCTEEPPEYTGPVTLTFEEETELFRTAWQVTLPEGVIGSSDAYSFTTELVDEEDDLTYAYTSAFVTREDTVTLPIGVLRFRLTDGEGNEIDPAQYTVSGVLVPSRMLVAYAAMLTENSPLTLELDGDMSTMESGSSTLRLYRLDEGELETAAAVSVQLPGELDTDNPYDEAYAMELADFGGDSLMLAVTAEYRAVMTLADGGASGFTGTGTYYLCHKGTNYVNLNSAKNGVAVGTGKDSATAWTFEGTDEPNKPANDTTVGTVGHYKIYATVDGAKYYLQVTGFGRAIEIKIVTNANNATEFTVANERAYQNTGDVGTTIYTMLNNNKTYIRFDKSTEFIADANDRNEERLFGGGSSGGSALVPVEPEPEPDPTYTLTVNKVDGHTNAPLSGAQFALYSDANCNNKFADLTPDANGSSFTLPTDKTLELGKDYWLKETEAPAGYTPLVNPIQFKADAEGNVTCANDTNSKNQKILLNQSYDSNAATLTLTVANYHGIELPATGGTGLAHWYAIGVMLLFGAAGLMCINNKQRPGKNYEKEQ